MHLDLTIVWAAIIASAIAAYVVLDGFDLGLGILFPLYPGKPDRDVIMNSVAPVWDGNETWLVLGGGGLFAAFPLAFAILMPAVYLPVYIMLLALIFRGVAFEFRWRSERRRGWWDASFICGSTIAAFFQGVTLGAVLQGVKVNGRMFGGGPFDWCTAFSVLTGLAVVVGYALLGATWLVMKTDGPLQDRARRMAWPLAVGTVFFIAAISLATPALEPSYHTRWLSMPNLVFTAPVPVAVAVVTGLLFRSLQVHRHEYRPFLLALALFGLTFFGLGISVFPYVVPARITIWEAAAPLMSQAFLLAGTAILLPMILAYTAYAYWVFRGKVGADHGYH
ncbi:cytochrome d ubiquinol oxidase subunit II [Sphingomonas sp. H39-1-10]|uniref:cytochrome d ubiquinol oxidase subunit II n=1 Tax=Sphingomonas TaxID=13687 RepID=UPI0008896F0F|nr:MULTISPECIES: cytochrome d ubiquinol oxidase subunit II [Sphingomonas]MDF0489938.1 cytochrome d ubiquinol oxidase subunit II [Sphingomonas pollutisoli]SDA36943.1 cytochrome bd-I ubiquinol oxidase subunit 2 apoprotein [Sphingomonas sp. NFR15]